MHYDVFSVCILVNCSYKTVEITSIVCELTQKGEESSVKSLFTSFSVIVKCGFKVGCLLKGHFTSNHRLREMSPHKQK